MDPRPRKTTLETFNEELAVLERPLDNDVEYYDEKPPSRWSGKRSYLIGMIAIAAVSGLVFVKMRSSSAAPTQVSAAAPVAAPAVAATAPAVPSPALAAATPAAAVPQEIADAPADEPAADDSAPRHAPSRAEWTKIHTKTTHTTHARSGGGGKVVYRRTTTVKRHVVVKRTLAGRR
jgi:hypothetical protein